MLCKEEQELNRLVGLCLREWTGLQGQGWDRKAKEAEHKFLVDLWAAHLEVPSGTCTAFFWLKSKPWL